jgi:phytoene dehydrogenase-like protein
MKYDAIVVGSGPNGLAAAITFARAGASVKIFEAKDTVGGGMRSKELTLPGFIHDVCSAIHPLAIDSPFFSTLPLREHGLKWLFPEYSLVHPFDDGTGALLSTSIDHSSCFLDGDEVNYNRLMQPLVENWPEFNKHILGPLSIPLNPLPLAKFGMKAILPSTKFANFYFDNYKAKALFSGSAAHSILPLNYWATSAIGLVLNILAHRKGWGFPEGGTQSLANALASYFKSLGGEIEFNCPIEKIGQLPESKVILFDTSPAQMIEIAGEKFSPNYKKQLQNYRYGWGVFKVDFALSEPVPWKFIYAERAGTLHLGGTMEEIIHSEEMISKGKVADKPFVLYAQQSGVDASRAPEGKHTGWAYCHVPNGYVGDLSDNIINQIERFAPGFKDIIIGTHTMSPADYQSYNPNYIGGDINAGAQDIRQLFTRPTLSLSPYNTSAKGIYICSSSTPPGGGVHGMCGFHAARKALKDIYYTNVNY